MGGWARTRLELPDERARRAVVNAVADAHRQLGAALGRDQTCNHASPARESTNWPHCEAPGACVHGRIRNLDSFEAAPWSVTVSHGTSALPERQAWRPALHYSVTVVGQVRRGAAG